MTVSASHEPATASVTMYTARLSGSAVSPRKPRSALARVQWPALYLASLATKRCHHHAVGGRDK
eukprot:4235851-Alexandrium_andersonii.AAC.1